MRTQVHLATADGGVSRLHTRGTGPEGEPFEFACESVGVVRAGRFRHLQFLPVGQVAEALRRYEALVADLPPA